MSRDADASTGTGARAGATEGKRASAREGTVAGDGPVPGDEPAPGDVWVYESIVGAVPGIDVPPRVAVAAQFAAFEAGVLALGWYYGLTAAVVSGTVAVLVAAAGSAFMLSMGDRIRGLPAPAPYRRLLFGSSIEVVLGLLAYVALLTYLFAYDPRDGVALLDALLGPRAPIPAVPLLLLVLWDVCYRIATAWWAGVAGLYRSLRFGAGFDARTRAGFRRLDLGTLAFGVVQLALVPLVAGHPLLWAALVGHVVAVGVVVGASLWLLRTTAT